MPRDRGSTHAVIVEAVRTPIGRHGGALAGVRPDDLAALVIGAVVDRSGLDPTIIDDVIFGCTNQAGEDNRNVARMATLIAGLAETVPGQTVNRLCASGLQAIASAAHAIASGEGSVFIAGGVESMTRSPLIVLKPDKPFARGDQQMADSCPALTLCRERVLIRSGNLASFGHVFCGFSHRKGMVSGGEYRIDKSPAQAGISHLPVSPGEGFIWLEHD